MFFVALHLSTHVNSRSPSKHLRRHKKEFFYKINGLNIVQKVYWLQVWD